MQTKVIGTEVIFVDPGVGQWGLKNFLGSAPGPRGLFAQGTNLIDTVAIGGDVIEVCLLVLKLAWDSC
jgi:hypothetical protein